MFIASSNPDKLSVSYSSSTRPYLNGATVGMVRYNTNLQSLEVSDGNGNWQKVMDHSITLSLQPDIVRTLDWAYKKMIDESRVYALAETNKSVAIALENLNKAKEQLKLTTLLTTEENTL